MTMKVCIVFIVRGRYKTQKIIFLSSLASSHWFLCYYLLHYYAECTFALLHSLFLYVCNKNEHQKLKIETTNLVICLSFVYNEYVYIYNTKIISEWLFTYSLFLRLNIFQSVAPPYYRILIYVYDIKYETRRKKEHDKYGRYTIDIKSMTLTIL